MKRYDYKQDPPELSIGYNSKSFQECSDGEYVKYNEAQAIIEDLTKRLIKSNKDYCPERIGYNVHYKYIHEHCDGLNCDQCTADQIAKGSE
jgi:hypothetical protein